MSTQNILVVDDDEEDFLIARDLLRDITGEPRYEALWARTPEEALAHMLPKGGEAPNHVLCLLDYRLGAVSGIEVLRQARTLGYSLPVFLLTGSSERSVDDEALAVGASDYLVKNEATPDLMARSIRYAVAQKKVEEELRVTAQALSDSRQREAEVGAAIQRTLLLRHGPAKVAPGLSLGVHITGAERVTGDYCDFLTFREQCFDVILGDVMGKGMSAALVGAAVKSHLQLAARRLTAEFQPFGRLPEPQEIVGALQAGLTPALTDLDCFVTLTYARFIRERNCLHYVDAGHPSILHWKAQEQEFVFLRGDNVPLGIIPDELYLEQSTTFEAGDVFVLYSDGLVEAQNEDGEEFGEQRLIGALDLALSPQEQADGLCRQVNLWRNGKGDDLTCVVVRIEGSIKKPEQPALRKSREFRTDPSVLEDLRKVAEDFCSACAVPELADHVVLGLTEAASNIIRHAYAGRSDQRFRFEASAYADYLLFRLSDRGCPFVPGQVSDPAFDGTQDGGFGWFMIQSCFDDVTYSRDELGSNRLSLKINLNTPRK
jgi:phosphoserine phosphatase RsbU/P